MRRAILSVCVALLCIGTVLGFHHSSPHRRHRPPPVAATRPKGGSKSKGQPKGKSKSRATSSSGKGFGSSGQARGTKPAGPVLPAGTLVKHGTTSDVLQKILAKGIRPSGSVSSGALRDSFEARPTTDAVYVATSHVAYSAALISFTGKIMALVGSGKELVDPDLVPLPVVLNIRLKEDCVLGADEDYLPVSTEGRSKLGDVGAVEDLWRKFGSGAILRDKGLPADWIESVECPHVPKAACVARASMLGLEYKDNRAYSPNWVKMPELYTKLSQSDSFLQSEAWTSSDMLGDRESMKLLVDDIFRLTHAYALTRIDETLLSGSLPSTHSSMAKVETDDGAGVSYESPIWEGAVFPMGSTLVDFSGPTLIPKSTSKPRGKTLAVPLSGKPSDWAVLDPDDPELAREKRCSFDGTTREKEASLRYVYARELWDCALFFAYKLGLTESYW